MWRRHSLANTDNTYKLTTRHVGPTQCNCILIPIVADKRESCAVIDDQEATGSVVKELWFSFNAKRRQNWTLEAILPWRSVGLLFELQLNSSILNGISLSMR